MENRKINKGYCIPAMFAILFAVIFCFNTNALAADLTIDGFSNPYSDVFDPLFYQNTYSDVKAAFGDNPDLLLQHFLKCGIVEGRRGSEEFDPVTYMNRYPDLQVMYGSNMKMYYVHYLQVGKKEGRSGRPDGIVVTATANNNYSNAYNIMISFKNSYPEGMRYTNDDFYRWKGGIYYGGYGCAGFAFMLSDAVFGDKPATMHRMISNIRVGDILRINNDTHSVIVLEVNTNGVVVAEGNYGGKVHWGRTFSFESLSNCLDYVMTRY